MKLSGENSVCGEFERIKFKFWHYTFLCYPVVRIVCFCLYDTCVIKLWWKKNGILFRLTFLSFRWTHPTSLWTEVCLFAPVTTPDQTAMSRWTNTHYITAARWNVKKYINNWEVTRKRKWPTYIENWAQQILVAKETFWSFSPLLPYCKNTLLKVQVLHFEVLLKWMYYVSCIDVKAGFYSCC